MTTQDNTKSILTYIEKGNQAARWLARHTGGIAQSHILKALFNIRSTAPMPGGAVIGRDASSGVVDSHLQVSS